MTSEKISRRGTTGFSIKTKLHKLVKDLPSEQYHGTSDTWSSSQFKVLLEDDEEFIKKYITKEMPREEKEVFDTGTYFHTGVLEPHKIKSEIAVYNGKTRFGKAWDAFKIANKGKTIITEKQKEQGDIMIKAVKGSPTACEYISGEPEVSLFVRLVVANGEVYAPHFSKVLTPQGWTDAEGSVEKGFEMIVKVRADTLGSDFISDLKSTSGNARKLSAIRQTISKYQYDLSAALYLDIFSLVKPEVNKFIWIFASKENRNVGSWRASKNQILVGRAKYMRAMRKLAECAKAKWEVVDCLQDVEPLPYEMEWLTVREIDLL